MQHYLLLGLLFTIAIAGGLGRAATKLDRLAGQVDEVQAATSQIKQSVDALKASVAELQSTTDQTVDFLSDSHAEKDKER